MFSVLFLVTRCCGGECSVRVETKTRGKISHRDTGREREPTRSKNSILISIFFFLSLFTTDIRLCSSRPCAINATCIETGEGRYLCVCPPGFSGENCHRRRGLCLTNGYKKLLFEFISRGILIFSLIPYVPSNILWLFFPNCSIAI